MNWDDAYRELRAWFAVAARIDADDVSIEGEPIGHRDCPWAEIKLATLEAPQPGDELRMSAIDGDDTAVALEAVGNRGVRLTCRLRTRDQTPSGRAMPMLERVRARLELPSSQEAFEAAGLALREAFSVVEMPVAHDLREESEAVLEIAFNYVSSSLDDGEVETVTTIAGVRYSGTAQSGSTKIPIAEQSVPEETL